MIARVDKIIINTGGGDLPAPYPRGATQRRRSAAVLPTGTTHASAMRRKGAVGPTESGTNPQGGRHLPASGDFLARRSGNKRAAMRQVPPALGGGGADLATGEVEL